MSEHWDAAVDDVLKVPDPKPALKLSMGQAMDTKPDFEAELRRAAVATGVPIDTARNDPKPVLAEHKVMALNLDGLADTNPATASFLSNDTNAKIAHDDVGPLADIEQTLTNLKNLGKASFFAAASGGAGYMQAMAPTMRSLGIHNPIGGEFDDPKSFMGEYTTALRKASKQASDYYKPQTDNPWAQGVNDGIVNIFQFAPITAGAVLTKNPTIALGAMGALSGGQAYGEAKDEGKSDAQARRYATVQGAIAILAQKIPLGQLLGDTGAGKGFVTTLLKNMAVEAPAMQAQTLASDFDRWVELNPDKPVDVFLKERGPAAVDALMQGVVASTVNTTAAHTAQHLTAKLGGLAAKDGSDGAKAVQAQQAGVILQRLVDATTASKLRERDPATFHDFMAQATADGPVDHLYIDPRHVVDVLAQGDAEKVNGDAQLLKAMPSVPGQLDEALRTGQDLKIPTAEFATYAAGSDFAQALLPHLKTDPNNMSLAESEVFLQAHAEELKASVQKIMAEAELENADQVSAGKVKDAVLAQLTEANRFTPDVNEAYAHLTAAFYATQAKRLGITPEEMLAQHPVQIAAEGLTDASTLAQDKPAYDPGLGFRSKLAEAVDKGPGKGSADQWEATLKNTPGVKKDETQWLGLHEFLAAQGEHGPITKDAVQAYIAQNGVQLEEHVLGAGADGDLTDRVEAVMQDNPEMDRNEAYEQVLADGYENQFDGPAKFDDYKLPGGTNYREVLLTMPHGITEEGGHRQNPRLKTDFTASHWDEPNVLAHTRLTDRMTPDGKKVLFVEEVQSDWHQKGRDQGYAVAASPEKQAEARADASAATAHYRATGFELISHVEPLLKARIADLEVNRDAALAEENAIAEQRQALAAKDFAPNQVIRYDDPEKQAAWDELKKKWTVQQHAREVLDGMIASAKRALATMDNTHNPATEAIGTAVMVAESRAMWGDPTPELAKMRELRERVVSAGLMQSERRAAMLAASGERGIPDAPFKTSWPALVMKRIIREAVEKGYDKVAWTTGEQQVERYNLSHALGGVTATTYAESGGASRVRFGIDNGRRDARQALQQFGEAGDRGDTIMTREQAVEAFGHDLGGRMFDAATPEGARFEGNDLRVGGEGMKAFYDRNLVNITNDLIKKMGTKVEPVAVAGEFDKGWASGETILRHQGVPEDQISDTWHDMTPEARADASKAYRERTVDGMTQPGFEITQQMRESVALGQSLFQGEKTPRGSFDPNTNLISLLKGADLSTYLHESGHFYLETLARVAASHPENAEINDDMAKALKFMGHGDKTPAEWLAEPLDARREGHETFARGFEAYLMEGKAPSAELRGVFQRFRSWLATVYKSVAGLRVSLTDDVRGVFDRMLASQQEIENAEVARGFAPLFANAEAAGMNPQEFEAYQRLGADATATAVDQLQTRSIRDMRWLTGAKDRMVRQLQKEGATKRKAVTAEVTKEVMAEPVNRARQLLKYGLLDGEEVEGVAKLSLPDLKEMYGAGGTAAEEAAGRNKPSVDYRELGYGKYGMLAEDGLHPDHVAELLGFSSGDELVRELLTAEPAKVTIEGKTDQRMLERYGDLADPDSIDRAADEAIHNDARLRFVATEANALAKATGQRRVLAAAAKAFAEDMIGRVKVRDLQPSRYQTAENRAANSAAKAAAKGDLVEAATEKRNQVVNGYATKAAFDAQAEVAKALRFFGKFDSAGTRKNLDPEYRDQIDSLLDRFDLSKNTTLKAIDKRKSLLAWYERMKAQDQEPLIPEELLNEANRKSYKDMTMDELRGLRDTVAQIAHLARLKNRLLAAKDARDFATTVEEAVTEIEASAIGKPRDLTESNQIGDKIEAGARGFAVMHRKFDSLITRLAGFVDKRDPGNASTLWSVLVRPKNEAADREATRLQASTEELQRIFKTLAEDRVRQKVFIPEINNSLSLEGRLAVLLNWGNEGNRQRVIDGDHWTPEQVAAIFKTLEPRHFTFAQELLDHLNSFKDEVAAAHKRRYGVEPAMVEAAPFQAVAKDGATVDMAGGYYPIKYDPNRSAKAADFDAIKEAKKAIVGSTRGYVKPGFYKGREDTVEGRPVSKSFGAAFQHVSEVIHDLAWGDYLIDAKRLLANDTLANSIRVHAGPEILTSLKRAVDGMEVGDIPAQNAFEKAVQYVNSGTTLAALGWNFIVSTKHPLGLFNGAARIGPQWIGVGLKRWIGDAAQMQNTVEWVHGKSEFMKSRAHGRMVTRDLQDVSGRLTTGLTSDLTKIVAGPKAANVLHNASTAVEHSFYWMIERGQMIADIPTWIGQYEKSMQAHGDDAKAVQQANQAVRDSQTTGGFSDLPEIQRGGPLMKLWTKFYSYFTVVYNQLAESAEETRFRGVSNVPALAGDVMLALIAPAIAGAAIQRLLPGGDQREDWAKYLGHHLMADMFGTMIGLRDVYAAFTEDKDAPGGMRLLKNTADLGKQVELGNFDSPAFWKSLNAEAGVLFHYPSATVQRFVTGMQAMANGQTHNPLVVMTGPHPRPKP